MKTLDEVIAICQGYVELEAEGWDKQDCSLPYEDMTDALHYLQMYRDAKERTVKVIDTWKVAGYDEMNAWCPECEHRITRGCSYCPTCGVKLDWSGNDHR